MLPYCRFKSIYSQTERLNDNNININDKFDGNQCSHDKFACFPFYTVLRTN